MSKVGVFARVVPELLPVLEELKKREPIFHAQGFGGTIDDFQRVVAPEYWEVGATGRRYSREFILQTFQAIPPVSGAEEWECRDFGLLQLGPDTYLLTYTLNQWDRLTRRATIWQRITDGWRILYHQGTVVSHNEDDMVPVDEIPAETEPTAAPPAPELRIPAPKAIPIRLEPASD
jgi:hypothetical protein